MKGDFLQTLRGEHDLRGLFSLAADRAHASLAACFRQFIDKKQCLAHLEEHSHCFINFWRQNTVWDTFGPRLS